MSNKLYSPSEEINLSLSTALSNKQIKTSDIEDTVVLEESSFASNIEKTEIKDPFSFPVSAPRTPMRLVTHGSKKSINLDFLPFAPTPVVLLSGKHFHAKYMKQLETYLVKVDAQMAKVLALTTVYRDLLTASYSVQLVSSKYKNLLPKIVQVLNDFFKTNGPILASIDSMINSEIVKE